jgi:glycine/D-amino acid oxidase-like deaminating enzyme
VSRSARADAIVIGAGIVGAACADALAEEGLDVAVYESGFGGGGTTSCAMGHLVVMDDSDAQFALTSYSLRLWKELADELPREAELERCGTLWIAATDDEVARARRRAELYTRRGVDAELLGPDDVAREEPNLRRGLAGGLRVPGDMVLYPPVAARWLLDRARRRGARLAEGVLVEEIGERSIVTAGGRIDADVVVNAGGLGAPRLTHGLPIEPRKGHLVITDRYPTFCRHQLIELAYLASAHGASAESVAFNLQPRATGQLLLGSSREFVGLDPTVNRSLCARMVRRASWFMPALAALSALRTWVGFRPCTPDNLPLIGPWSASPGQYVAAGHEGLGVTTALGTARLLADRIVGREPEIDPSPYLPNRFARENAYA